MSLSNIELFYSPSGIVNNEIIIAGEDYAHITRVMRHINGDKIFVTNGKGNVFESVILDISKDKLKAEILNTFTYENKKSNITFCIPKLKNPDRFEFSLEKCVELGITSFIIFESKRTVSKGDKNERWNKILIAAMKQSLLSYLPEIKTARSIKEIMTLPGTKIGFEQNSEFNIKDLIAEPGTNYYFIFGPEGGLDNEELGLFNRENIYKLAENRLRSETAIVKAASLL